MLDLSAMAEYLPEFVEGFIITAQVSIISIIGSFIVGLMVALARVSTNKIFNFISLIYVCLLYTSDAADE